MAKIVISDIDAIESRKIFSDDLVRVDRLPGRFAGMYPYKCAWAKKVDLLNGEGEAPCAVHQLHAPSILQERILVWVLNGRAFPELEHRGDILGCAVANRRHREEEPPIFCCALVGDEDLAPALEWKEIALKVAANRKYQRMLEDNGEPPLHQPESIEEDTQPSQRKKRARKRKERAEQPKKRKGTPFYMAAEITFFAETRDGVRSEVKRVTLRGKDAFDLMGKI